MRTLALLALLLAGCAGQDPQNGAAGNTNAPSQIATWDIATGGEGAALVLASRGQVPVLRLLCPAGARARASKLLVNVPSFTPIGSEERLSIGQGGEVVALVAETGGDPRRGGVTAEGPVPSRLGALLSGQVSASYGSQTSGPHPSSPAPLVEAFVQACSDRSPAAGRGAKTPESEPEMSACRKSREGQPVPANTIRGIGTEPFWAVIVEGRCVTYSHPENQSGTRVWTEFSGSARDATWRGFLNDQPFVMKTRPQPGCSDGMSDKRYPIAVTLTIMGEERRGCAEPR